MDKQNQIVSTEAQRLALETMSAQLVHKLNAMIAEQEARTRDFAKQHHPHIALPQTEEPITIAPRHRARPAPGRNTHGTSLNLNQRPSRCESARKNKLPSRRKKTTSAWAW